MKEAYQSDWRSTSIELKQELGRGRLTSSVFNHSSSKTIKIHTKIGFLSIRGIKELKGKIVTATAKTEELDILACVKPTRRSSTTRNTPNTSYCIGHTSTKQRKWHYYNSKAEVFSYELYTMRNARSSQHNR